MSRLQQKYLFTSRSMTGHRIGERRSAASKSFKYCAMLCSASCQMGATHFLTKTKENVSTEMSLHILAYNLKRVMKIMGSGNLMKAMAT